LRRFFSNSMLMRVPAPSRRHTPCCVPVIRVWSPDPASQPEMAARMQLFADNMQWLEGVLRASGVEQADIMPPLARGLYVPAEEAPELNYEMFTIPKLRLTGPGEDIATSIDDELKLLGTVCPPFRHETERNRHIARHDLRLIASRNISESVLR
jgi:hypothetical protein